MVQKHYMDIQRLKEKYASAFSAGERIVVEEKVDGANASFTYDKEKDAVVGFSRNNPVSVVGNTLSGFANYVENLDKSAIDTITLGGRYIIFGEWLVKHTIKYPENAYKKFYMFDVWDTVDECYLEFNIVKSMFDTLKVLGIDIEFVPIFFTGTFTTWEDLMDYVGRTEVGAEPCGEGIVVKTLDRLNDSSDRTPKYLKIVSDRFSEVQTGNKKQKKQKSTDPEVLKKKEVEREIVASVATNRRIDKCLEKLVDEGVIPSDWDEHNMKDIAKTLPKMCWDDVIKEEPEIIQNCENAGKIISQLAMGRVRTLLNEKSHFIE